MRTESLVSTSTCWNDEYDGCRNLYMFWKVCSMARDKQMNVLLTAETVDGLRAEAARSGVNLSEVAHGRMEGHARHKTALKPETTSRSNEMRFRPADIRVPNVRRADTPSSGASPG